MRIYLLLLLIVCSCRSVVHETTVFPKAFKVEFNHDKYASEILLPVSFGGDNKKYLLQFDNHSPSWINEDIINVTSSFRRVSNTSYETSVADGRKIKGDVYICDTVSLGGIKLNDALFYRIDDTSRFAKGVIGENIITKGVWVIDYQYDKVIFTSSMDSLDERYSYERRTLPTVFKNNNFIIEAVFKNGVRKQFEVDLGFNGWAILPINDFKRIQHIGKTVDHIVNFGTPGGQRVIKNYTTSQKAMLGSDSVFILVSSNENVAESIVGLAFFAKFHFVILDYPNRHLYVSRR